MIDLEIAAGSEAPVLGGVTALTGLVDDELLTDFALGIDLLVTGDEFGYPAGHAHSHVVVEKHEDNRSYGRLEVAGVTGHLGVGGLLPGAVFVFHRVTGP